MTDTSSFWIDGDTGERHPNPGEPCDFGSGNPDCEGSFMTLQCQACGKSYCHKCDHYVECPALTREEVYDRQGWGKPPPDGPSGQVATDDADRPVFDEAVRRDIQEREPKDPSGEGEAPPRPPAEEGSGLPDPPPCPECGSEDPDYIEGLGSRDQNAGVVTIEGMLIVCGCDHERVVAVVPPRKFSSRALIRPVLPPEELA